MLSELCNIQVIWFVPDALCTGCFNCETKISLPAINILPQLEIKTFLYVGESKQKTGDQQGLNNYSQNTEFDFQGESIIHYLATGSNINDLLVVM